MKEISLINVIFATTVALFHLIAQYNHKKTLKLSQSRFESMCSFDCSNQKIIPKFATYILLLLLAIWPACTISFENLVTDTEGTIHFISRNLPQDLSTIFVT